MKLKGYLIGIVAAASYGLNPLFALPCYGAGMNPDSVLLFRYLFAVVILAVMLRARGRDFRITRRQIVPLAILGILVALSSLTLFASYNYMAAGIASTLLFVYPVMVALIMALVFHERLNAVTIASLFLALAGIAMLYNGPEGATLSLVGTLLVMLSSLSYAIYIAAVNKSGLDSMPTLKVTFYVMTFGVMLFIGRFVAGEELVVPSLNQHRVWGCLFGLALFPTAISFLCTNAAIQRIGSTNTAILGAFEPVTAIIIGLLVFNEQISPKDWAGIVMIIAAVTMVVASGTITHHLLRLRKLFPSLRHRRN